MVTKGMRKFGVIEMSLNDIFQKFLNETSSKIDGWFYPLDIFLISVLFNYQKIQKIEGDIAEFGVYHGKSLIYLSQLTEGNGEIIGFDIFPDDMKNKVELNIKHYVKDNNIRLITGDSADYNYAKLQNIFQRPIRILHIDAGHEYYEVLHTLNLVEPFMHDLGIIIMDDYQDREFPGIEAATLDFCYNNASSRQYAPFLMGANKAYLANPIVGKMIQRYLFSQDSLKDKCRLTHVRDDQVLIAMSKLPMATDEIQERTTNWNLKNMRASRLENLADQAKKFQQLKWMLGNTST